MQRFITRMGAEVTALVKSAQEIAWFSRGAWNYHQVLLMTLAEREMAVEFINERLKIASKSTFPVY